MVWDVLADEEHGEVVGEVVAVVEKEVIRLCARQPRHLSYVEWLVSAYLSRVDLFQTFQVLEDDFKRKVCPTHRYDFHGSAMMGGPRIGRLHACPKEVLYSPENDSSVVHSVNLDSKEASRHLPGQTLKSHISIRCWSRWRPADRRTLERS